MGNPRFEFSAHNGGSRRDVYLNDAAQARARGEEARRNGNFDLAGICDEQAKRSERYAASSEQASSKPSAGESSGQSSGPRKSPGCLVL